LDSSVKIRVAGGLRVSHPLEDGQLRLDLAPLIPVNCPDHQWTAADGVWTLGLRVMPLVALATVHWRLGPAGTSLPHSSLVYTDLAILQEDHPFSMGQLVHLRTLWRTTTQTP
jgi:hypothetical protein